MTIKYILVICTYIFYPILTAGFSSGIKLFKYFKVNEFGRHFWRLNDTANLYKEWFRASGQCRPPKYRAWLQDKVVGIYIYTVTKNIFNTILFLCRIEPRSCAIPIKKYSSDYYVHGPLQNGIALFVFTTKCAQAIFVVT